MSVRNCDACGKKKETQGGRTCEKGHFVCKDCVYSGIILISEKKYCPLCKKSLRQPFIFDDRCFKILLDCLGSSQFFHLKHQATLWSLSQKPLGTFRIVDGTELEMRSGRPAGISFLLSQLFSRDRFLTERKEYKWNKDLVQREVEFS